MQQATTVKLALSLFLVCVFFVHNGAAFRGGIGRRVMLKNFHRCRGEDFVCYKTDHCCGGLKCDFTVEGFSSYGRCREAYRAAGEGKDCDTDQDCGKQLCCRSETVGFRGVQRNVCRRTTTSCAIDNDRSLDSSFFLNWIKLIKRNQARKRDQD